MNNTVVVWNKVFRSGEMISKFITLTSECDNMSIESFRGKLGDVFIMKELFDEDIECANLSDSELYRKYQETLNSGINNDMFCKMYKLKEDLAVSINEHIHIHHLTNLKIESDRILP